MVKTAYLLMAVAMSVCSCTVSPVSPDSGRATDASQSDRMILWGQPVNGLQAGILCNAQEYVFGQLYPSDWPTLACYVKNVSKDPITLSSTFGYPHEMTLMGQGTDHPWPSYFRCFDSDVKTFVISPGEEVLVFGERLSEVLSPHQKQCGWDWLARPEGPRSPAHRWRADGYEASATFWFVISVDGKTALPSEKQATSQRITIRFASYERRDG
jgi:hypothetical protein